MNYIDKGCNNIFTYMNGRMCDEEQEIEYL